MKKAILFLAFALALVVAPLLFTSDAYADIFGDMRRLFGFERVFDSSNLPKPNFIRGFEINGTDLTAAEVAVLDVTAGTVTASKAVVVDANKDVASFRNVTVTNLDAGASGTAGTVDVFPATAAKGKFILSATDNTTAHNVTLTNAPANGASVVVTLPALTGYAALSTAALTLAEVDVLDAVTAGTVAASKALVVDANKDIATLRDVGLRNVTATGAVNTRRTMDLAGTVPVNRLVAQPEPDGPPPWDPVLGFANAIGVLGINVDDEVTDDDADIIVQGIAQVVNAGPILGGWPIKCARAGKIALAFPAELAGDISTLKGDGGDFANQPATDGVTVVSDAADTAVLTITGHVAGSKQTEDITLDGTTPVNSLATDWTDILGVEVKTGALAGTVTVTETSGGLTITTLAPGTTSAGVIEPSEEDAFDGWAWYVKQKVKSDDANTAYVYVVGVDEYGDPVEVLVQLNGTTGVTLGADIWETVTKIYAGASAAARDVIVYPDTTGDPAERLIGRALETQLTTGELVEVKLF